jgi:hypothetical protein
MCVGAGGGGGGRRRGEQGRGRGGGGAGGEGGGGGKYLQLMDTCLNVSPPHMTCMQYLLLLDFGLNGGHVTDDTKLKRDRASKLEGWQSGSG